MKKIVTIFMICVFFLYGCKEQEQVEKESTMEHNRVVITKVKVDSIIYKSFENLLETTYNTEPYYSSKDWMDEDNKLKYPYQKNDELMSGIENILASLYMPEDVINNATTEELLYVVTDGLLETYATAPSLYNTPSDYVSYCSAINQATNELLQRSDMATVVYEDYCTREYDDNEVSFEMNKLQLEEIILGSNHGYKLMDDDMRDKVIREVLEKDSKNSTSLTSGFFAIIEEEYQNGESLWYTYICDNKLDEAKELIDINNPSWRD